MIVCVSEVQMENNPELLSIPYVIKFYHMVLTTTA